MLQTPKQKNLLISPMKKKKDDNMSAVNSNVTADTSFTSNHSQPISVPVHRKSKTSLESKSFSPSCNSNTPDMVVDAEFGSSSTSNVRYLLQVYVNTIGYTKRITFNQILTLFYC